MSLNTFILILNLFKHFFFRSQDLLRRLSSCLNGLATSMNTGPEDQQFLDWVVWFCSNVDYDLDDEDLFPPL